MPRRSNRIAGPFGGRHPAVPFLMCVMCCQAYKRKLQDMIAPAITLTAIGINGIPCAVPVCLEHLEAPEGVKPAKPERASLVDPFTGGKLSRGRDDKAS